MNKEEKKQNKNKGFFTKLIDNLDKKMEKKSKKSSCCGKDDKGKGSSCC